MKKAISLDGLKRFKENIEKEIVEKVNMVEENFVQFNDVYIGGATIDEDGNLHMPTATYNEENKSITIL